MKREHYDSDDPILDKKLTYFEFLDLMSDAWLEAETNLTVGIEASFRREFFRLLDLKMNQPAPSKPRKEAQYESGIIQAKTVANSKSY